ncbi:MAG: ABC transporter permease [bacterium]|nr:MAG: ABC transporter permease [bacterium]
MRYILLLLSNDVRRRLRSPLAVILMMCIPLVITLIIGLVFGRSGTVELPRIKVLLLDKDQGFFGDFLASGMQQGELAEMIELVPVEEAVGLEMMQKGKASAMIEIPEGFTNDLLDHKQVELRITKNPSEAFLPMIAEEVTRTMALILDGGMRIFAGPVGQIRSILEDGRWPTGMDLQGMLDGARDRLLLVNDYISDSLITYRTEVVSEEEKEEEAGFNVFAYVLPGSMLIGLLFISEIAMRDLLREGRTGTLARLFTTPVEGEHIVTAKILSTFVITAAASVVLLLIGRFGFGIALGRPAPLILQLVGTILMCTGVITFFYGFLRSERAADAVLSVVIIIMCLFGGSMVPIEQMGRTMLRVGRFSPVFWAINGFKRILVEDMGLREIVPNLIVLYSLGIVTILAGAILLKRRVRRGGWSGSA